MNRAHPLTWIGVRRQLKEANIQAMRELGLSSSPQISIEVINDLNHPDTEKRWIATCNLAIAATKDCSSRLLDLLLPALKDTYEPTRMAASGAFAECGYAPATEGLIQIMKSSSDQQEIERTGYCLCGIGEKAVPPLLELAIDKKGKASSEAVNALYNMGEDVVDWLLATFQDEASDKWTQALVILSLYPHEASSKLNLLLEKRVGIDMPLFYRVQQAKAFLEKYL